MEVGQGVITGGWDYVIAAYSISWVVFIFYTVNVILRARREESQ